MITNYNIIYKAFEKKYVAFNSVIAYQFDRDFFFSTFMKKCYQPCVTLGGKHLLWINNYIISIYFGDQNTCKQHFLSFKSSRKMRFFL